MNRTRRVPFLQFFPAIMLAAWFGGFGPGVVAVGASAALVVFFFLPPTGVAAIARSSSTTCWSTAPRPCRGVGHHRLRRWRWRWLRLPRQVRRPGPGIPPEVREKVFTPFFTTKTRGSGLGLPTCRRLIEAHRGTLAIDCPPQGRHECDRHASGSAGGPSRQTPHPVGRSRSSRAASRPLRTPRTDAARHASCRVGSDSSPD